jgi:UDP-N-acetyl-2-amino-2-deoxyglucuronate dehydrogenase
MIGIAIIGSGAIAEVHIQAFKIFQDRCEVRALADLHPEKAEKLARSQGLRAFVCKDFREAFSRDDIELVSVCAPPSVHAEAAVAALEAGKHVIVEKPMASSLEECDAMIRATEKAGRLLSVIAQNRYKIPVMKVKKIFESGTAGRILHATANSYWWRGQNYYDLWWRGTWKEEGGGCTLNHAVHHIDLLRWVLGMPEQVTAVFTNVNHLNSETEDLSIAVLNYAKGSLAQVTSSLVDHGEEQELVFQTERARVSVPWRVKASLPMENGFPKEDPETERELQALYDSLPSIPFEGHPGQIDNVLQAIEGKAPLLIDAKEGRATLEVIMGIYKAAATRTPVPFPLRQNDPMYRKETMLALMPRFHEKTKRVQSFAHSAITLGRDLGS